MHRQFATTWRTLWCSIRPLLEALDADPARFDGVSTLGVDEHIWHHVSTKPIEAGGRGLKKLTGMVNLTCDAHPRPRAQLLDLVPGQAYTCWLTERGQAFRTGVQVATLDPFRGYKNAIGDQLDDARAVLDAFHVVKLAAAAAVVDDVRRRVQQDTRGHRGRRGDPLYRIRNILRAGQERTSPTGNEHDCTRRGPLTSGTSRSNSPGSAPSRSAPPPTKTATPPAGRSPGRSSRRSPRARSERSPAWAGP